MNRVKIILKVSAFVGLFLFSALGFSQDSLQHQPITRQSLEKALGRGFVIDKIKGIELKLGGHLQVDAIFDTHKTASTIFFKPSQIQIPSQQYARTLFNINDSRLRFTAINTGEEFKNPLKMLLEFDFRNEGNAPRIRHAWLEVGSFGAGQTWSNIIDTDAFPNIILNMGGPNSFSVDRPIQFRYSHKFTEDAISVSLEDHKPQVSIPDTWDSRQIFPNLTVAYKKGMGPHHLRFAALLKPISYNNEVQPDNLKTLLGYSASITGKIDFQGDKIKFNATYGSGNSGYIEDLNKLQNEAVVIDGKLETIDLFSTWIFYEHQWSYRFLSTVGYGLNSLGKNSEATANKIHQTHMVVGSFQYQPLNQFKIVWEGIYGQRNNYAAVADATDLSAHNFRFQFTTLYVF